MLEIFSLLGLSFLFGIQHAFDADHIAAVSVLNAKSKKPQEAVIRGIYWGLGHTLTLFFIGLVVFFLGLNIPEKYSHFFEFIIALMLTSLGMYTLVTLRPTQYDKFSHSHPPFGLHGHKPSFFIGILHGLAGSAGIFVLFIAAIKSALLGLFYILIFGIGSIFGMAIFSLCIGIFFQRFKKYARLAAGVFSISTGLILFLSQIL